MKKDELYDALVKRALGHSVTEESTEYSVDDNGVEKLVRKKISVKQVPPELSAIKLLIKKSTDDFDGMTEEQLLKEKERLLKMLSDEDKKQENKKWSSKKRRTE